MNAPSQGGGTYQTLPASNNANSLNWLADVQISFPVTFYPRVLTPVRAKIPKGRLAGVYMGMDPQANPDVSFGTGQVQWNAGGPVHNPPAPLRTGPLPNFPVIIAANSGWRGAGHSR